MAVANSLTRQDLSQFLPNQKAVRAFEQTFEAVDTNTTEVGVAKETADSAQQAADAAQQEAEQALAEAQSKQPKSPVLTGLSSLPPDAGVIEQTAQDDFAIRPIGVGEDDALLTRADGDTRYVAADEINAPWTTYVPTLTAGSGTLGSATATGRYKQIGKTVFIQIRVNITTNGSAAGYISASVPVPAGGTDGTTGTGDQWAFIGRETAATGFSLLGSIPGTSSTMIIQKYDATYPGADGYVLQVSGVYEAA